MGNQRVIWIQDEDLNDCLKKENNVSGLICKLLNDYYKRQITPEEKAEQLKIELENKKIEIVLTQAEIDSKNAEIARREKEEKDKADEMMVKKYLALKESGFVDRIKKEHENA